MTQMGQIETDEDLKSWTPSVFIRRVRFVGTEVKGCSSLYFLPW